MVLEVKELKEIKIYYSADKLDFSTIENTKVANTININYSNITKNNYVYDADNKVYLRSVNGTKQTDYVTGKQLTVKNIIVYSVKYSTIDDYGRQTIDNVGTGNGYYISNGVAVPITWKKDSRSSQTIYKLENGEKLNVNDGNKLGNNPILGITLLCDNIFFVSLSYSNFITFPSSSISYKGKLSLSKNK